MGSSAILRCCRRSFETTACFCGRQSAARRITTEADESSAVDPFPSYQDRPEVARADRPECLVEVPAEDVEVASQRGDTAGAWRRGAHAQHRVHRPVSKRDGHRLGTHATRRARTLPTRLQPWKMKGPPVEPGFGGSATGLAGFSVSDGVSRGSRACAETRRRGDGNSREHPKPPHVADPTSRRASRVHDRSTPGLTSTPAR